jgi:hypothetical protein
LIDEHGGDPDQIQRGGRREREDSSSGVGSPNSAKTLDSSGRTILPGFIVVGCTVPSLGHASATARHADLQFLALDRNRSRDPGLQHHPARDIDGAEVGFRRALEEELIDGPRSLISLARFRRPAVRPEVTSFVDGESNTISYVVKDPSSLSCAVIDPVS